MLRRDAIKLLGLSGLSLGALPSSTNAGTFLPAAVVPAADQALKDIKVDLRNSTQFVMTETDTPRHIIDFYWSPTCKYSCITSAETIRPISSDQKLRATIAARYTMVPRYQEEVEMGALMLSVPPADYPALCIRVLTEGARSKKGYLTIEEVSGLASQMGASSAGSSGYDPKVARASLELTNSYYVQRLREPETPAVYVDGRKIPVKTDASSFDMLKEALA
jgi:hypothetical protein